MRNIVLNLAVTLDGFIEGPHGEVDWCSFDADSGPDSGIDSHFDEFLASIDTIFYGRVSYDAWGEYQPADEASQAEKKLWDGVHSKTKYVFSRMPGAGTEKATYITSDIASKVNELKTQPGKDIWLYGGSGLITSFINMGLIDRYLLAVYPIILGSGKPLFSRIEERIQLKPNKVTTSESGVTLLDYSRK